MHAHCRDDGFNLICQNAGRPNNFHHQNPQYSYEAVHVTPILERKERQVEAGRLNYMPKIICQCTVRSLIINSGALSFQTASFPLRLRHQVPFSNGLSMEFGTFWLLGLIN